MEEKKLDENKKRLDLKKYEPIQDIETVDLIMQEMKENKIYPSDALRGVILTKINKLKVQKYLVEKFQETRNKIEHRISKRNNNNNKEVKK